MVIPIIWPFLFFFLPLSSDFIFLIWPHNKVPHTETNQIRQYQLNGMEITKRQHMILLRTAKSAASETTTRVPRNRISLMKQGVL